MSDRQLREQRQEVVDRNRQQRLETMRHAAILREQLARQYAARRAAQQQGR